MDEYEDNTNRRALNALVVFGIIIILLIGSTVYFAMKAINKSPTSAGNITANITAARKKGITVAIIKFFDVTNNCQLATISYGNVTRQIVDTLCIPKILDDANMTIVRK